MLNSSDTILGKLCQLGLDTDEAKVYLELLREPHTHLRLSHITGINRTKVYRLVENLEKKSLVSRRTDDRGTFLVASDPSTLEVRLVSLETKLKQQRTALTQLLPQLDALALKDTHDFVVRTYEGVEGLKQMCWHELKTKGELLSLGGGMIEEFIPDHRWAEKTRALTVEAGYSIREIINPDIDYPPFTNNQEFMNRYTYRKLPSDLVYLHQQTIVYNNTVAIYHWRENQKVGVEIVNKSYAQMMRQIFEHFWQLAEKSSKR